MMERHPGSATGQSGDTRQEVRLYCVGLDDVRLQALGQKLEARDCGTVEGALFRDSLDGNSALSRRVGKQIRMATTSEGGEGGFYAAFLRDGGKLNRFFVYW